MALPVDLNTTPASQLKPLQYAADNWFPPSPASGQAYTVQSLYRWARKGIRGIQLTVLYTGSGAVTSEAAVKEFLSKIDRSRRLPDSVAATDEQLSAAGL